MNACLHGCMSACMHSCMQKCMHAWRHSREIFAWDITLVRRYSWGLAIRYFVSASNSLAMEIDTWRFLLVLGFAVSVDFWRLVGISADECMTACMHSCLPDCMHAWRHSCMHECLPSWMHECMHECIHAWMHAFFRVPKTFFLLEYDFVKYIENVCYSIETESGGTKRSRSE